MTVKDLVTRNRWVLLGLGVGLAYGLAIRIASRFHWWVAGVGIMAVAFLFATPFVMGFITVFISERQRRLRVWMWFVLPWLSVVGGTIGTLITHLEGYICIAMFLPIGMVCATIGGVIAGLLVRFSRHKRSNEVIAGCVLFLPLLITPWEQGVFYAKEIRNANTFIDIEAPSSVIWRNIERVPAIQARELPASWSHRIGFPNPVEATLSREGIGGVRHAIFSGGVVFVETIDVWQPLQRLGFNIRAQTDQIPRTTLDDHVRIGGPFFDVLHGEYHLERISDKVVRLHLSSQHRVSTDFNWYAEIWTDAIMADLQNRILRVIKARCEREAVATGRIADNSAP
jgi:hypothetical protein